MSIFYWCNRRKYQLSLLFKLLIKLQFEQFQVGKIHMAKKNQRFTKIYRQFTRVKYEKYRLQFPRNRQSELIDKIVKEWEAMDDAAKQDLQRKYDQGAVVNFMDSPSSSEKKKQQKKKAAEPVASAKVTKQKKITKQRPPSPKVKVFVESSIKKSSPQQLADFVKERENSKSPGKKSTPEKGQSSSSQLAIQAARGGSGGSAPAPKKRTRAEEYQNFFKYYYERLKSEHPRWSKQQITTIIKLLWRKRGGNKTTKRRKSISGKSLTGRQLFNKTKLSEGMPRDQIKQLWRALPHESKKYWQIKAQGRPNRPEKDSGRFVRRVLNAGASKQADSSSSTGLSWMNQQIR